MLEFFRRYQKYLYILITTVIIISFSFFGTYSTITRDPVRDRIVFTTVDGTGVKQSDLEEMATFISTDNHDKQAWGGAWGANFLNDGVIRKDFLETGLAQLLASQYIGLLKNDLESRVSREKRYTPYKHPRAPFLGAESAWGYFAPEISKSLYELRTKDQVSDPASFDARVKLFLAERKFPSEYLRYVLRNQEKQFSFISPDPDLMSTDLSLFGYHTLEDWFGKGFVRLVSEFIINASTIAEEKGYKVSKEEALADLLRNAEISYQQNLKNPNLGVANSTDYFQEQLRRLGIDQNIAVRTWRQVMLFRRLFHDVGNAAFVDPFTYERFNQYARASLEGDLYRLPKELRFKDFNSLQKMEWYLNAISKRPEEDKISLNIPKTFRSLTEIAADHPELVQRRYLLNIAEVNKNDLQSKVGVKETWNWEVDEKNWNLLKKEFPELAGKASTTREDRFNALEKLEKDIRSKIDDFARLKIVETHPEWLNEALENAKGTTRMIGLSSKGGTTPFAGLKNRDQLLTLLNQATLEDSEKSLNDADKKLQNFTADNTVYYKIKVLDRDSKEDVLTFAEANQNGVIDPLLNKDLEAYYLRIREATPEKYQHTDKSWMSFDEARNQVAEQYYSKMLKAIETEYKTTREAQQPLHHFNNNVAATLRFMAYMKEAKKQLKENREKGALYVRSEEVQAQDSQKLSPRIKLQDQWKLEKIAYKSDLATQNEGIDHNETFNLAIGNWTDVQPSSQGELYFFQLKEKRNLEDRSVALENFDAAQRLLSNEAQQNYFQKVIQEIKKKDAISLDYLNARTMTAEQDV